jgi:hypothetical protein
MQSVRKGHPAMSGFFSKLFGGSGGKSAPAFEAETYKGYVIEPRPKGTSGTYNIAGNIRKEDDPDGPSHDFIRADTFTSTEEAARFSIIKAKQIIDQQGDRLLK